MKVVKNVYETTYDGWIICSLKCSDMLMTYEGRALCPPAVRKWLEDHEPIKIDDFCRNAIAYGYCE